MTAERTSAAASPAASTDGSNEDDLTCIEPHPYGVLPSGNIYVGDQRSSASSGSGRRRRRQVVLLPLPDEIWQQVLQFCDGISLAQVVQTCRHCYVIGHAPELWRDLVLREYSSSIDSFYNNWKDTYVMNRTGGKLVRPHVPMVLVPGIVSEVHYRTHMCRSFPIPSSWLSTTDGTVERVSGPLTEHEFVERYEQPNTPVVLQGVAKSWKAMKKWNRNNYLTTMTANRTFRATSGAAPLSANFTIQAYADYCRSSLLEEAPLYLFDRTALTTDNSDGSTDFPLRDDFEADLQRTCPFWDPKVVGHDLFQHVGSTARPDHTWLICGPRRSGSAFHMDPNATHAWNAAICGRKRWIFYPPGVTPPGVFPSKGGDAVAMPISIGEWFLNYYQQEHIPRMEHGDPRDRPLECTVEPGDVIFVPHGWWHAVVNLDEWNVAITHNYVSESNLATVLLFLEKKQDQISGCRDRQESCKPEYLKQTLERALVKNGLQDVLTRAQQRAARGWPCRAWTDDEHADKEDEKDRRLSHSHRRKRARTTNRPASSSSASCCDNNSIMAKAKKHNNDQAFSFSFL